MLSFQLTVVSFVLRRHKNIDALQHVGATITNFLGPNPNLTLSEASNYGSVELMDWMWGSSCTSADTRSTNWTLLNYLRSDPHYRHWQFVDTLPKCIYRGDLESIKWLCAHFTECKIPITAAQSAASLGHLHILKFLAVREAGNAASSALDFSSEGPSIDGNDDPAAISGVVTEWGVWPLWCAVNNGRVATVQWLYRHMNNDIRLKKIKWIIGAALELPDVALAESFVPAGQSLRDYFHACCNPPPEMVELFLDRKYYAQNEQAAGDALHHMAQLGRLDLVQQISSLYSRQVSDEGSWRLRWSAALEVAADRKTLRWMLEHSLAHTTTSEADHLEKVAARREYAKLALCESVKMQIGDDPEMVNHAAGKWRKEAAETGDLETLQLLHELNPPVNNVDSEDTEEVCDPYCKLMKKSAGRGHLAVVKWLHENLRGECSADIMDKAAAHGHLEVVKWLHTNCRAGCTTNAMDRAAENGNLDVVIWLHENRGEGCTTDAIDEAAFNGNMEVIEWLYHNRAEGCTVQALRNAVDGGYLAIVSWLHTRFPKYKLTDDDIFLEDIEAYDPWPAQDYDVRENVEFEVLLFLHEHFASVFTPYLVESITMKFLPNRPYKSAVHGAEWLRANYQQPNEN